MPLRSFSKAELLLSKRKRMDRPLLLTVWVSMAACSLAEGQWFYLLVATFTVGLNMAAAWRDKEVHLNRAFINVCVLFVTGILVYEVYAQVLLNNSPALRVIGHYLILLQICKLFERKTNRDYVQLLALSGLSIVAGALLYHSLWFAALAVLYLVLLCYTAMVFTLKRGLDAAGQAQLVTESGPLGLQRIAWNVIRTWPGRAIWRRVTQILAAAVIVGILVFMIFPRTGSPSARHFGGTATTTGFDSDVRLGDATGKVYQSNDVLMHVRFKGSNILPGPDSYLRGVTFDTYLKSRWSNRQGTANAQKTQSSITVSREVLDEAVVQEISMDASLLPTLFACYPAVRITSSDHVGEPRFGPDLTAQVGEGVKKSGHLRYTAYSIPRARSVPAEAFTRALRAHSKTQALLDPTQGVEASSRVRDLARQWCSDLLDQRRADLTRRDELDQKIARQIARNLKRNYTYTLDLSDVDPSADGVEDFLFQMKRGHCEYFASAMTVLCRTLGVHARLVTGFAPSEHVQRGDYYIVRGRDAHAWTEVFTPTTDWVAFDATPPSGREMHGASRWAPVTRLWARIDFLWYDNVIGYDARARVRVGKWIKNQLIPIAASLRNLLIHGVLHRLLVRFAILIGLVALMLEGILVSRWIRQARRKHRQAMARLPVSPRLMRFARRLISLLEREGLRYQPEQTLREFTDRAADSLDIPGETFSELVDLVYRVRWGRTVPTGQELRNAERQVSDLASMLRS